MNKLICSVCGKDVTDKSSIVCCGQFGAVTNRYCVDCANNWLEPYGQMVSYIACAGHFPDEINETYQKIVRHNLDGLHISEEQFIEDVNRAIVDMESDAIDFDLNYDEAISEKDFYHEVLIEEFR